MIKISQLLALPFILLIKIYRLFISPPLNNELHLSILLAVRKLPLNIPCFLRAIIPYSEHDGV